MIFSDHFPFQKFLQRVQPLATSLVSTWRSTIYSSRNLRTKLRCTDGRGSKPISSFLSKPSIETRPTRSDPYLCTLIWITKSFEPRKEERKRATGCSSSSNPWRMCSRAVVYRTRIVYQTTTRTMARDLVGAPPQHDTACRTLASVCREQERGRLAVLASIL